MDTNKDASHADCQIGYFDYRVMPHGTGNWQLAAAVYVELEYKDRQPSCVIDLHCERNSCSLTFMLHLRGARSNRYCLAVKHLADETLQVHAGRDNIGAPQLITSMVPKWSVWSHAHDHQLLTQHYSVTVLLFVTKPRDQLQASHIFDRITASQHRPPLLTVSCLPGCAGHLGVHGCSH